jgi:hypothetical protein
MPIGSSSSVRTGASVVALGNAEGQGSITAAAYHVTGLNQVITVSDVGGPVSAGTLHGMIQTNAGGPARRHGAEHTPSHRRSLEEEQHERGHDGQRGRHGGRALAGAEGPAWPVWLRGSAGPARSCSPRR